MTIAKTPRAPYYAVIFTSIRTAVEAGYRETADAMVALAATQHGFLGMESAHAEIGITISYWDSLEAIARWKSNAEHLAAQKTGREKWYSAYTTRICRVEREYSF
jgi:heme-degrading monooxygenase HmoA